MSSAEPSTSTNMPPTPRLSLTLIVAATPSLGIGRGGSLPWPQLRSEMAYFARVTKRASPPSGNAHGVSVSNGGASTSATAVNAVVMGRRTWDSIPPAFRPLRGRINVVVSRSLQLPLAWPANKKGEHDGTAVLSASSVEEALHTLANWNQTKAKDDEQQPHAHPLGKVFVIGGAEIYRAALKLPQADRVLLTRIANEFECDVHFPLKLGEVPDWKKAEGQRLDDFTGESVPKGTQSEKDIEWEFEMWEKVDGEKSGS